jgi:hypothetical protein
MWIAWRLQESRLSSNTRTKMPTRLMIQQKSGPVGLAVFLGLCRSSNFLNTREHNVWSVSTQRWRHLLRWISSDGPRVGVSFPSPVDGKRSSFRNVVFSSRLEFWRMNKVRETSNSECYRPSSERFRFYRRSCFKRIQYYSLGKKFSCSLFSLNDYLRSYLTTLSSYEFEVAPNSDTIF